MNILGPWITLAGLLWLTFTLGRLAGAAIRERNAALAVAHLLTMGIVARTCPWFVAHMGWAP